MKKLLLFVMIILPAAVSAQTVSGLKVETASGSPSTVTFDVSWTAATLPIPWLDSMWVFVDYNINGKMERLLISGGTLTAHSANPPTLQSPHVGTVLKITGNDKGAWVVGDARTNAAGSFSAKVELYTKETDIIIAGACAYASSYPPVGDWIDDTRIGFNGTPWYEITLSPEGGGADETVKSGSTFLLPCSYTVSSFTDKTGAPGIINCKAPTALTLASPFAAVCAGATVTLTASATDAAQYRIDDGAWQASDVFEVSPAANASYTLYAKTADDCVASAADAAVVTVNPVPAISLSNGDASQSVNPGTAIATIVYTASDAATISMTGSLPAGVTVDDSGSSFTISGTPTEAGIFGYSLTAAAGGCTGTASAGTLIVAIVQPQSSSCTYTEPAVVGTFADFHNTPAYTATTYTSLMDERDSKAYPVVKIGGRWIMARNLNYQEGLIWEANAVDPPAMTYSDLIGYFWCPGGYSAATATSTRESCDVWGALYAWETAMMLDGYGTWTEVNAYNIGAANAANSDYNHGRTDHSGTGTGGRGICPPNWHVPTDNEWGRLSDAMEGGGTTHQTAAGAGWYGTNAGIRGRAVCTVPDNSTSGGLYVSDTQVNWYYYASTLGTDTYNFHVLPTGVRNQDGSNFYYRGIDASFWSSTSEGSVRGHYRDFAYSTGQMFRQSGWRSYGFTIRCMRD